MAWFLSFLWKRANDERWHPVEATTEDEHPLAYVNRARRTYADDGHEYRLLFFSEIPSELVTRADTLATRPGAIPRQPLNVR